MVAEGHKWVDEWLVISDDGTRVSVVALGEGELVEELRITGGLYEMVFRWLGGAVEAEVKVKGKRHYLRVEMDERSWFLGNRDELSRVVMELGAGELVGGRLTTCSPPSSTRAELPTGPAAGPRG